MRTLIVVAITGWCLGGATTTAADGWVLAMPLKAVTAGEHGWQRFGSYATESECREQRKGTLAALAAEPRRSKARQAAESMQCLRESVVDTFEKTLRDGE